MATFTDQMRDLAKDILNGHRERMAWLGALRQEVGSMQADNRAWLGTVRDEASALREEVEEMLGENEAARRDAAVAARKERKAWRGALRKEVKAMRHEFSTDRRGARQVWRETIGLVRAGPRREKPARAEARAPAPRPRPRSTSRRGR